MSKKPINHSPCLLLHGLLLASLAGCAPALIPGSGSNSTVASRDANANLGNPSNAGADPNNYLMEKANFTLSYNRQRGTANWVSWHLSSAWKGGSPRSKQFTPDTELPTGWYAVRTGDYTNSGFDRGHLCPSDDRDATDAENAATFVMTNIVPQSPRHNRETWKNLEDYCRKLASEGNELYIIAGPFGTGGTGDNGYQTKLADGRVTVPASLWKIVVVLPIGSNDPNRIDANTRVIAVSMPNKPTVADQPWRSYLTSVDALEKQTGYNFLSNTLESVQQIIEARVDEGQ